MTLHRSWEEQSRLDEAEDEFQRIQMLEQIEPDRTPARLDHMSWPTADISVERVRPAQREFEPRNRVRSHEVRAYGKTSLAEWLFLIGGITLCAAWLLLLAAVMYAVTVG